MRERGWLAHSVSQHTWILYMKSEHGLLEPNHRGPKYIPIIFIEGHQGVDTRITNGDEDSFVAVLVMDLFYIKMSILERLVG